MLSYPRGSFSVLSYSRGRSLSAILLPREKALRVNPAGKASHLTPREELLDVIIPHAGGASRCYLNPAGEAFQCYFTPTEGASVLF